MAEIKIKSEYYPERCEICHQSDLYKAESNYCARCSNIEVIVKIAAIKKTPKRIIQLLFPILALLILIRIMFIPIFSYFYIELHFEQLRVGMKREDVKREWWFLKETPSERVYTNCAFPDKPKIDCKVFSYYSIFCPELHFCAEYDKDDNLIMAIPCHE